MDEWMGGISLRFISPSFFRSSKSMASSATTSGYGKIKSKPRRGQVPDPNLGRIRPVDRPKFKILHVGMPESKVAEMPGPETKILAKFFVVRYAHKTILSTILLVPRQDKRFPTLVLRPDGLTVVQERDLGLHVFVAVAEMEGFFREFGLCDPLVRSSVYVEVDQLRRSLPGLARPGVK